MISQVAKIKFFAAFFVYEVVLKKFRYRTLLKLKGRLAKKVD